MNYTCGMDRFAKCDFCGTDESGTGVKFVLPIGDKGICSDCTKQMAHLVAKIYPNIEPVKAHP